MKISIAQLNTNTNDFDANLDKIVNSIKIAEQNQCDIVLTPELSLCGYLVQDLMYHENFVHKNLQYLQGLAHTTSNMKVSVIVGFIDKNYSGHGKKYSNCVALISKGVIQGIYKKRLLPFYDVFAENRYFEPGKEPFIFNLNGKQCGIVCCEDIWAEKDEDNTYQINPIDDYRNKVDYLFCVNSSPWYRNKEDIRISMCENIISSFDKETTLVYCNQVGGQDELIFDGNSFITKGCKGFADTLVKLDNKEQNYIYSHNQPYEFKPGKDKHEILRSNLVLGLRDYIQKSGFKSVIVGSSGGIDSALVLSLACDAIGSGNVYGLIMPTVNNNQDDRTYAFKLHEKLCCHSMEYGIDYQDMLKGLNILKLTGMQYNTVADQNIQARLRDIAIMHYANAYNLLPLATGNKTEAALGYYTLFDMNLGFAPIIDLYKRDVYTLARSDPKIPLFIKTRRPTAGLEKDQYDEEQLLPYTIVDEIVFQFMENYISNYESFCKRVNLVNLGFQVYKKDYDRMINLIYKNEFKRRQSTLGLKTTKHAYGSGHRMPVCKG